MSETLNPTTPNPTTPRDEAPARRLVRVDDGRWLGGVAAGLGRYFDVNPLVYRIAFAALAFAGGTGVLVYVAAWLVIPPEDREDSAAVRVLREHRDRPWLVLGVGLLACFALLALTEASLWHGIGNLWLAALLGGAALLWWNLASRSDRPPAPPTAQAAAGETAAIPTTSATAPPPAPAERRPSLLAPVLGALLAAAGVLGLLAVAGGYEVDAEIALAVALAVVGTAIAVGAFTGFRVSGLVGLGLVLLAAFAVAGASPVTIGSGIGEETVRPLDAPALERSYEHGIGEFELDLRSVALPEGETSVDVSLGIGELRVLVPEEAAVEIDANAGAGEVEVLGSTDDGIGANRELSLAGPDPDSPTLVLDASVGFGHITIERG